jgi:hypothetical protein
VSLTLRPARLAISNESDDLVRIAVYKRSPLRPGEPAIAWTILSLPPRGRTLCPVPRDIQLFARYSFSPERPASPFYQTGTLRLRQADACFALEAVTADRRTWSAALIRASGHTPGPGRVRIINRFGIGAWSHIQQAGRDLFAPRILPPGAMRTEDLLSPFHLAIVGPHILEGAVLPDEEILATEAVIGASGEATARSCARAGWVIRA